MCLVASLPFPTSQIPNAHTPSTINRKKNCSRRLQSLSGLLLPEDSWFPGNATPGHVLDTARRRKASRAYAVSERPSLQGLGSDSDSNFISTDSFHLSAGHPLLRPTHLWSPHSLIWKIRQAVHPPALCLCILQQQNRVLNQHRSGATCTEPFAFLEAPILISASGTCHRREVNMVQFNPKGRKEPAHPDPSIKTQSQLKYYWPTLSSFRLVGFHTITNAHHPLLVPSRHAVAI